MPAHPSLAHLAHRPWPLPSRPWVFRQVWHDLLFLHWPVSAKQLRPLLPSALVVEEHSGSAWVAVTPFWMSDVGIRVLPAVPVLPRFEELNARTYVNLDGRPGVWFFSLDAANRLFVQAARALYGLPYYLARMQHHREGQDIEYHSLREDGTGFAARYGPTGPVERSHPGTLIHWLTERYCLFAPAGAGRLQRAEIHHEPWPLQPAAAAIRRNDLLRAQGIEVSGPPPQAHYAKRLEVVIWPPERAG